MISASQIREIPGEILHYVQGPLDSKAQRVLPPELANSDSLVFVSKAAQLSLALERKASIIIAHKSLNIPEKAPACFFTTSHVTLAMAMVGTLFDKKIQRFHQDEHIHPKSSVHPSAQLGKNVIVGPCAVIGAEVHVGNNSIIGANAVIESHARIGANTIIHPQAYIGTYCEVGSFCEIQPHVTIGADGFGFVPLKDSHPVKIPQLGKVIIEDHVEIGANCTIDRAALTETRIRSGVKLDKQCHIAHNCDVGENSMGAGGFMMAGSSKTGKNFMAGGNALISDHVEVGDNVMIAGLSGVTKDITEPGQYGGYPLQGLKDSLKTLTNTTHLTAMRKQLSRILKHLNLSEE
ncbi:MAG: UDP-3-O-(3-hydroxymyristoyl)glucosamine N-acyltransferase [Bdellovibrionaceae bacterium]|nr:UDP-3-O-(3-hydroxymyristoyl)glucosamine N-acyltransferase [Pseudobdellovibrionaceae bacterium]